MVSIYTIRDHVVDMGGVCKKVHRENIYECAYESVSIRITPEEIEISPITESDFIQTVVYNLNEPSPTDWETASSGIYDEIGVPVDLKTEEWLRERFVFTFSSSDYRKALRFAKRLADDDIWVRVKLKEEIVFKRGDDTFDDVWDFAEYLKDLV